MADEAARGTASVAPPAGSGLALRLGVTLGLIIAVAVLYAVLGAAGAVPLPRSVDALAARQRIGHGRVLVVGYYLAQPFVSYGGTKLPPYVFAATTKDGEPAIHVTPALEDLHAGRMVAMVDTATGDGSRWSPYVIHSVMRAATFSSVAVIVAVVVVILAFGIAGPLSERLQRGRS